MPQGLQLIPLMTLLLAACSGPISAFLPMAPNRPPLVTADPLATPTGTPFSPLQPTATQPAATPTPLPSPTPANPWGEFPGPTDPSAIEIPPPMPRVPLHEGTINVLLLGSDQRPNSAGHRTDTMIVVSLDPSAGTATLISFPRDLYVYIPGWRVDRINVADGRGGPELAMMTILYNFGIPIHYWARMNYLTFVNAIDTLGGIEVQVTGYLNDECGGTYYEYSPGTYYMDGWTAMCYVRMRKRSSDFDRLRRQQEVLRAIFSKVLSIQGLARLPQLYSQFKGMVETNMPVEAMLPIVPLAARIGADPARIRQFSVTPSMTTAWRVPYSGAAVLLPKREAIQAMLSEAFPP